jgi:hypothetical protein
MTFDGFVRPTRNWFSMPNNWTDITAEIDNLAELKVVEYVARHTWGFHEFGITKTISTDEFMHGRRRADGSRMDKGTGLKSDRSAKDGCKLAIEHGYLECEVDTSDQGRTKKSYALKMAPPIEDTEGGYNVPQVDTTPYDTGVDVTPTVGSIYPSGVQHLPIRGTTSTHRTEKDTLERNSRKTPKKDSNSAPPQKPDKFASSSPGAQAIILEWKSCHKKQIAVTDTLVKHAETLKEYEPEAGEIAACVKWLWATNREWYESHGLHLGNVVSMFERFRSLADVPARSETTRKPAPPPESETEKQAKLARAQAALASLHAAQPVAMGGAR